MPSDGPYILAVDPGRDKIGLAILDLSGNEVEKRVIPAGEFDEVLDELENRFDLSMLAVGDGTESDEVLGKASARNFPRIISVPEKGTTLEARELAWKEHPPGGLWRILPRLFWPTPRDLDAWAAVVIGRRALEKSSPQSTGLSSNPS